MHMSKVHSGVARTVRNPTVYTIAELLGAFSSIDQKMIDVNAL